MPFLVSPLARALPNSVLGAVNNERSPLDGRDLTDSLLDEVWRENARLPGKWADEGMVENARISHLLAKPAMFGRPLVLVRAIHRDASLETIECTFADAGSHFGYRPAAPDKRRPDAELAAKQQEFATLYEETLDAVKSSLAEITGRSAPKEHTLGRTRALRAKVLEWQHQGRAIRLLADGSRLIRLTIHASPQVARDWLDDSLVRAPARERAARLARGVSREADGTVLLPAVRPIPQGFQPYCGLNTLAMSARHFGLHIDEDWLAVAGGFRNTGSAAGSDIIGLYPAVAAEAGFGMKRVTRLDFHTVKGAIDQGFPVVVWRRFSHERDQLHSRFVRELARDPSATLPSPADPAEVATWPGKDAPLHASVIVGYHEKRGELLFLESWTGKDRPRRMTAREMAATISYAFVFGP
ncbi:MAG: hypothetical protein MUF04_04895 [Akkermansiaceae bacterium]|nr:hypothetical protein [Akkermansiaceae bacterium]